MKIKTQFAEITSEEGICETFVAYPENTQNLPIILFYMDAVGLRPRLYEMVEKLASFGFFVLAPNLFYRTNKIPIVDYDIFMQPQNLPEMFKQIRAFVSSYTPEMSRHDSKLFLDFSKSFPMVNSKKIGAVGYCMGGAQALRAAGNYPEEFSAIASFHAGNLATDSETSPHLSFKKIKAEVYIGHADKDGSMPPEQIEKVERELKESHLNFKTEIYNGCLHGWTMTDLPAFNQDGEKKHWEELLSLFKRAL